MFQQEGLDLQSSDVFSGQVPSHSPSNEDSGPFQPSVGCPVIRRRGTHGLRGQLFWRTLRPMVPTIDIPRGFAPTTVAEWLSLEDKSSAQGGMNIDIGAHNNGLPARHTHVNRVSELLNLNINVTRHLERGHGEVWQSRR